MVDKSTGNLTGSAWYSGMPMPRQSVACRRCYARYGKYDLPCIPDGRCVYVHKQRCTQCGTTQQIQADGLCLRCALDMDGYSADDDCDADEVADRHTGHGYLVGGSGDERQTNFQV